MQSPEAAFPENTQFSKITSLMKSFVLLDSISTPQFGAVPDVSMKRLPRTVNRSAAITLMASRNARSQVTFSRSVSTGRYM
jgi:hypothetical protein